MVVEIPDKEKIVVVENFIISHSWGAYVIITPLPAMPEPRQWGNPISLHHVPKLIVSSSKGKNDNH